MSPKRGPRLAFFLLISLASTSYIGCARSASEATNSVPERRAEPTPIVPPPKTEFAPQAFISPTPTPRMREPLPAPTDDQIREAVARVFAKSAAPEAKPRFVVGDFNGDGSEDLAVAVRVDEHSLGEINNELANWTLEDPRNVRSTRTASATQVPVKPVRAEKDDTLLAIIHGVGAKGWRSAEARQTYLLKNGVGGDLLVKSPKNLLKSRPSGEFPRLKGDAISETSENKSGLLFWTGADYAWHSAHR